MRRKAAAAAGRGGGAVGAAARGTPRSPCADLARWATSRAGSAEVVVDGAIEVAVELVGEDAGRPVPTGASGSRAGTDVPASPSIHERLRAFAWRALKAFKANQGLLLAGAVAYYALLSIVPLLILFVIALSHVIDEARAARRARRATSSGWCPGRAKPLVGRARATSSQHREVMGWVLLGDDALLQLARLHRARERDVGDLRPPRGEPAPPLRRLGAAAVSATSCSLGVGMLLVTLVIGKPARRWASATSISSATTWALGGISGVLLYLLGVAGEVFVLTSIYLVMPVGRLKWRHALIGGVTAALLWELTRHVLLWYFAHALAGERGLRIAHRPRSWCCFRLELAAILLLFGAQVIAEYERDRGSAQRGAKAAARDNCGPRESDAERAAGPAPRHSVLHFADQAIEVGIGAVVGRVPAHHDVHRARDEEPEDQR